MKTLNYLLPDQVHNSLTKRSDQRTVVMQFIKTFRFSVLMLLLSGCVNVFDPEIKDGSGELVVSGVMTDLEQAHYVYITRTRPLHQTTEHPGVSGADVRIVDDEGLVIPLVEQSPGTYATADNVKGVIGKSYHVEIDLEGRQYESEPEQIQKSSEILALKASFKEHITFDGITDALTNNVVAFYVDVKNDEPGVSKFYKYTWDATYKIEAPFKHNVGECPGTDQSPFVPFCYVSESSDRFLNILALDKRTDPVYTDHLVAFVEPNIRFMLRYSFRVNQYSLTSRAFEYWEDVKQLTQSTGTLFDPPPTQIRGNMKSTSHPKESVLGYFVASSVVQKREFFSPATSPLLLPHLENCYCFPARQDCIPPKPPPNWVPPPPKQFCCDCRYYENSNANKPDFWID